MFPYYHHTHSFSFFFSLYFSSLLPNRYPPTPLSQPQALKKSLCRCEYILPQHKPVSFFEISCFGLSLCANGAITLLSHLKKCPSNTIKEKINFGHCKLPFLLLYVAQNEDLEIGQKIAFTNNFSRDGPRKKST